MADIPEYMTYSYLRNLRQNNAAWRLLTADQAAFIAAFFYREFIAGKRRGIEAQELLERLDLFLYDAQRQAEGEAFGRSPQDYLEIWSDSSHGWLRKYEYHEEWYYDLTAPAQKAVEWLVSLHKQDFVGTESRLRTVFNLLHEIARETDTDVAHRRAWLVEQQEKIAAELEELDRSSVVKPRLDEVQIKERFLPRRTAGGRTGKREEKRCRDTDNTDRCDAPCGSENGLGSVSDHRAGCHFR